MEKNRGTTGTKTSTKTPRHQGVDPRGVFRELMAADFDPNKVDVLPLKFGERMRGKAGERQVVSVVDPGDGSKIDVFPILSRFQPTLGRTIRCYVVYRTKAVENKRTHKTEERITGFAIPVNLREASRRGEWFGLRNNIIKGVVFNENRDGDGWYAFGPNGKVVIVGKDDGLAPSTKEAADYMVSEKLSCFIAHCVVPPSDETDEESTTTALVLQAETVGAIIKSVDEFGFTLSGRLHDACETLNVPATASVAEIKAAYRALSDDHPDKKRGWHRDNTGSEPTPEDTQAWEYEWKLIETAKERMLQIRLREQMRRKHLKAGRKAHADMPAKITVEALAQKLGTTKEILREALKKVGYPGVVNRTVVEADISLIVAGFIDAGGMDGVDDLSDEADPSSPAPAAGTQNGNGGLKVDIAGLKIALGANTKVKVNGERMLATEARALILAEAEKGEGGKKVFDKGTTMTAAEAYFELTGETVIEPADLIPNG